VKGLVRLVWANLMRRKVRTAFTLLAIVVAFFLFGLVAAFKTALGAGIEVAGADRLVMRHKVSIIQPLPIAYGNRLASIPGVAAVAHANWFGGIYQEPKNFFPQLAIDPGFLDLYPEFLIPDDQRAAWMADRAGAIVGRGTAEKYGFEIGDVIPIQGTFNVRKDGANTWEFNVRGIYDGAEKGVDNTQLLFHYEYLDEARAYGEGLVGWYVIRVADPDHAVQLADTIDRTFANSAYETKTATEKEFVQSFADQIGDIGAIATLVAGIVFFTILLVTGSTMAQAVRERTGELAVLKTLGFRDGRVLGLVLAESLALTVVGGAIGLGLAWLMIQGGDPTGGLLPVFYLPGEELAKGAAWVLALGLAAGILPAMRAMRLRIVDALRRGG
jgi:putative ABC transport system permease protein